MNMINFFSRNTSLAAAFLMVLGPVLPASQANAAPGQTLTTPVTPMELPIEVEIELSPAGSLKQALLWKEFAELLENPYAEVCPPDNPATPLTDESNYCYSTIERRPGFGVPMPPINTYALKYNFLTGQPMRLRTSDGEVSWDVPGPLFAPDEVVTTDGFSTPTELRTIVGHLVACPTAGYGDSEGQQQACDGAPDGSLVISRRPPEGGDILAGSDALPNHGTVVAVPAVVGGVLQELAGTSTTATDDLEELETPINEIDFIREEGDTTGLSQELIDLGLTGREAAEILGKALFWDMQIGSDGVQACASCHFNAGVDNRTRGQLNPGTNAGDLTLQIAGPNEVVVTSDFPFHKLADPEVFGESTNCGHVGQPACGEGVISDANDVMSSMGVSQFKEFQDIPAIGSFIDPGNGVPVLPPDIGIVAADPVPVNDGLRRVEPRNTPTFHGAAFNFDNFWDARARFFFNGGSVFGPTDPQFHIFIDAGGPLEFATNGHIRPELLEEEEGEELADQPVRISFSSLASQAVGPPLSDFEMSFLGRNWPKIGKKMLQAGVTPLANQLVATDDSVLGPFSNQNEAPGMPGLSITYPELIMLAFRYDLWGNITHHLEGIPAECTADAVNGVLTPPGCDPFDGYVLAIAEGSAAEANTNIPLPLAPNQELAGIADFNNDGNADILIRNSLNGRWHMYLMDGADVMSFTNIALPFSLNQELAGIADFNNDGNADILIRNSLNGHWHMYLMDGADVTPFTNIALPLALNQELAGIADFDNDGNADILIRNSLNGHWHMYLMNGADVTPFTNIALPTVEPNLELVGIADFDNDGNADVLIRNSLNGRWHMYLMDGADVMSFTNIALPFSLNQELAGIADFNNDGNGDILIRNSLNGHWHMYLMDGADVTPFTNIALPLALNQELAGIADFDNDGNADILIRNSLNGHWHMYLMDGADVMSFTNIALPTSSNQELADIEDFDGNNTADILIRNSFNGHWHIYLMNGAAAALDTNQFTQMEANFSLFFGLSVQAYEQLTIPDHTLADQFFDANPNAGHGVGEPGDQAVLFPTLVTDLLDDGLLNGTYGGTVTLIPDNLETPEYDGFGADEVFGFDLFAGANLTAALAPGESVGESGRDRNPLRTITTVDGNEIQIRVGSNPFTRSAKCMLCHLGPEQTDHSINISHGILKNDAEFEYPTPPYTIDPNCIFGVDEFISALLGEQVCTVPAPEPSGSSRTVPGLIGAEEVSEGPAQDAVEVEPRGFATLDDPATPWDDRIIAQPSNFAFGDQGVYNIGLRPNIEDLGRGGPDPFGWTLSLASMTLKNIAGPDYEPCDEPGDSCVIASFDPFNIGATFEETGDDLVYPGTMYTLQSVNPGFERSPTIPQLPEYLAPWVHSLPAGELHPQIDEMAGMVPNTLTPPNGGPAIEFPEVLFGADLHCALYDPFLFGEGPPSFGWGPTIAGNSDCPNNQSGVAGNMEFPVHGTWPVPNRVIREGAFKAPSLRNVELTGPFFHTGSFLTLRQVVDFYFRGGDFPVTNAESRDPNINELDSQTFSFGPSQGTFLGFDLASYFDCIPGEPNIVDPPTVEQECGYFDFLAGSFGDGLPDTVFLYDEYPDSNHPYTPEPVFASREAALEDAKNSIVKFLIALTDPRVRYEIAPFDHPEIFVPIDAAAPENEGGPSQLVAQSGVPCPDTTTGDVCFQQIPAVGFGGKAVPVSSFLGVTSIPPGEAGFNCDPGAGPISHFCP